MAETDQGTPTRIPDLTPVCDECGRFVDPLLLWEQDIPHVGVVRGHYLCVVAAGDRGVTGAEVGVGHCLMGVRGVEMPGRYYEWEVACVCGWTATVPTKADGRHRLKRHLAHADVPEGALSLNTPKEFPGAAATARLLADVDLSDVVVPATASELGMMSVAAHRAQMSPAPYTPAPLLDPRRWPSRAACGCRDCAAARESA